MGKKRVIKKTGTEVSEKSKKATTSKKKGKAKRKSVSEGRIYISATYNNTAINLTDKNGEVLGWSSAGSLGFKGTKKATPYAASEATNSIVEKMEKLDMKEVDVFVKGVGSGRSSALRVLAGTNVVINSIKDVTPIPHNGCRPRKPRRV